MRDRDEQSPAGVPRSSALRLASGLLAVIIVPDLPLYVGVAPSAAGGTAVVACTFVLSSLPMFSRRCQPFGVMERWRSLSVGVLALCVMTCIAAHAVLAAAFLAFDAGHALASAVLLAGVILAGGAFADVILAADERDFDRVAGLCLLAMGTIMLEGIAGFSPPSPFASPKPMFPFTEPSHFALTCAPFLMFCAVRRKGAPRAMLLLAGALAGLMMQNLTFLIAIGLTAALCMRRSWGVLAAFALIAVAPLLDLSYYSNRLDFSDGHANLSALVYLQGWQLIVESLRNSFGWGLGFQQLGIHGTAVEASDLIYAMVGGYGNTLDGSFTFSKITSEFGVLGLLLIVAYSILAFAAFKSMRAAARGRAAMSAGKTFAAAVIVSYGIELFVRGGGYFTGTSLLLVAALRVRSYVA